MKNSTLFVSAAALIVTGAASAQFTGAYAPGTWTISGAGIGPSSATWSAGDTVLTIVGPDGGAGNMDVTHSVTGAGTWSFDWSYSSVNTTAGFDNGYYLLNGSAVFLATTDAFAGPVSGSSSVAVAAGDTIGWRVDSVDGLFGPGTLTITNFVIPAPGALALLGLAGLAGSRRRA